MLYTRAGDTGTTRTFSCDQRISKSSAIAEALGSLDEINSLIGLCKVASGKIKMTAAERLVEHLLHEVQENLFIIQAELAGADKSISKEKVGEVERIVDAIEKDLPPITTFFISGGTELAALFDVARTIARRAERRVVAVVEEGKVKVSPLTLSYLNRLSSLLYAFARYANHFAGVSEDSPSYE